MSITLQKPLGNDIYDISVFNENATLIENFLNNLDIDSNNLKFYNNKNVQTDLTNITDGLYLCSKNSITGTLPNNSSDNFLILKTDNNQWYIPCDSSSTKQYRSLSNNTWSTWTYIDYQMNLVDIDS